MRFALALLSVVFLASCPRDSNTSPNKGRRGGAGDSCGDSQQELRRVVDTKCRDRPCVLHVQAGTYHRCLSGGAGTCFHFGETCVPDDKCMYDGDKSQYRACEDAGEGECESYGAACSPGSQCMVDPSDGLYRQCGSVADGRCASFGAICDPA